MLAAAGAGFIQPEGPELSRGQITQTSGPLIRPTPTSKTSNGPWGCEPTNFHPAAAKKAGEFRTQFFQER